MSKIKIKMLKNGPCIINGTATYTDEDGKVHTTPGRAIALCRCGVSSKKPFCDGGHTRSNFQADALELVHVTDG